MSSTNNTPFKENSLQHTQNSSTETPNKALSENQLQEAPSYKTTSKTLASQNTLRIYIVLSKPLSAKENLKATYQQDCEV